ncbi:MAG: LamG-like jellyroll fold domain-containing protein, partial [Verrucomicrobiota bacterium]
MKLFKHRVCALALSLLALAARAQSPMGDALAFNGVNQYVTVTNFGAIIPTNEITVEFWAYTTALAGQSAFMLNPDQGTNRLNAHINYNFGPTYGETFWDFGDITGSGRLGPVPAPANSISNWVHYALVASRSGNYMSIYTNGVLCATRSGMTPFVRGNYSLQIGGPGYPY